MTWKVAEDVLAHIDVIEQGKENAFSLGRSLMIGNEVRGLETSSLIVPVGFLKSVGYSSDNV